MREVWKAGLLSLATGALLSQATAPSQAAVIRYTSTATSEWTGPGPAPTGAISLTVPDAAVDGGEFHAYAAYLPGYGYGNHAASNNGLTPNNHLARYKRVPYPSFTSGFSGFVYSDGHDLRPVPEIDTTDGYLDDPYADWILVQMDFALTFANGVVTSSHADFWDGVGPDLRLDGTGSTASGVTLSDAAAGHEWCPSFDYYCRFTGSWLVTDYAAAPTEAPEPGTLTLLAAGLVALGLCRGAKRPLPNRHVASRPF